MNPPSNAKLKKGALVLQKKTGVEFRHIFEGLMCGAPVDVKSYSSQSPLGERIEHSSRDKGFGEAVFNTSMTGYQEILTDPSYYGQILCFTYPHIGNTGVNDEDLESARLWCSGVVVSSLCTLFSNYRSKGSLNDYLIKNGIPALTEVDTRALTRTLRSQGATRAIIVPEESISDAQDFLARLPKFEGRDLISEVSTKKNYPFPAMKLPPARPSPFKVIAVDFGIKTNLLRELSIRGCEIEVVSAHSSAEDILKKKPDGVFLSNGPGDPSAAPYAVNSVSALIGKVPIFGVCMGHQILSLALGGKTYKLKFGHRGGNQPVFANGLVEISSHNHGYAVAAESLPKEVEVTHISLNDKTVEGIRHRNFPAFSVQYHPEASPGPHDSKSLFDHFIKLMETKAS